MQTVYEKKTGKAVQVEGVDAREYVASGAYTNEDPSANKAAKEANAPKDEKLTVDQLKTELTKLKVEFPANANKAELEKLLAEKLEADKVDDK